jgi:small multidrug resistance pump
MLAGRSIWLMMAVVVVLNTAAQALLKLGAGRGLINGALAGGLAAYGLSTLVYILLLTRAKLSFAYPVVIGATAIATCVAGAQIFGERIVGLHWIGITLILAGIACIAAIPGGV